MLNYPSNIYRQAIVVLDASTNPADRTSTVNSAGNYVLEGTYVNVAAETTVGGTEEIIPENRVFQMTLASVPVIWATELSHDYQELGQALSELTELNEESDWQIASPVYNAACNVAAVLKGSAIPAPRVFNHGPKSVVFNWTNNADNLYLTISADQISALISSPERIKRRLDYTAHQLVDPQRALEEISASFAKKPVKRLITGAVSDLIEQVD